MIVGEKIILREFKENDLNRMHAWVNNEEITKNLNFARSPRTVNDTKIFLEKQLKRTDDSYIYFVIGEKSDSELKYIGSAGLKNIDLQNRKAEYSIVIGFKEFLGKGYGTEATALVVKYGFEELGLNKIYLKFIKFNKAAQKAYKNAGFKPICEMIEDIYYKGQYYNQIYMELLKNDYKGK